MFNFLLLFNILLILNSFLVSAKISDKRLCGNSDCSQIIGKGKTQLGYGSNDPGILSFKRGELVEIYSKSAGTNPDLWGVKINGKRGYVPRKHILETSSSIIPTIEVTTDEVVPSNNVNDKEGISPEPTKTFEVVDGTTVYDSAEFPQQEATAPNLVSSNEKTQPLDAEAIQKFTDNEPRNSSNGKEQLNGQPESVTTAVNQEGNDKPQQEIVPDKKLDIPTTDNLVGSNEKTQPSDSEATQTSTNNETNSSNGKEQLNNQQESVTTAVNQEGNDKPQQEIVSDKKPSAESPIEQEVKIQPTESEAESASVKGSIVNNLYASVVNLMGNGDVDNVEDEDGDDNDEDDVEIEEDDEEDEIGVVNTNNQSQIEPDSSSESKQKESSTGEQNDQVEAKETEGSNNKPQSEADFLESKSKIVSDGDNKQNEPAELQSKETAESSSESQTEEPSVSSRIDENNNHQTEQIANSEPFNEQSKEKNDSNLEAVQQYEAVTQEPVQNENVTQYLQDEIPMDHNETEVGTTPQTNLNKIETSNEKFNSAEIKHEEFKENSNYLFDKDKIDLPSPPPLAQIHNGQLTFVGASDPLVPRNDPVHSHENQEHISENQNALGVKQDASDRTNSDSDQNELSSEEIKDEKDDTQEQSNNVGEEGPVEKIESHKHDFNTLLSQHVDDESSCSADPLSDCQIHPQDIRAVYDNNNIFKLPSSAILAVLVIAAVTVVTFLWGYMYMEKRGRESKLVGKINNIQKDYLIAKKENEILKTKLDDVQTEFNEKANTMSNKMLLEVQEQLEKDKTTRTTLELQIQNLEKELENSTEVGLELNRMLSEFLNSENGSETLVANIEQLQRQIIEQQATINAYNENLSMKETENHELRLEVEIYNTKVTELRSELDKMALSILKLEEDKEQSQSTYETDLQKIKGEIELKKETFTKEKSKLKEQLQDLKDKYEQMQRDLEVKSNEYLLLKEGINQIKKLENNGDALKSLLDVSSIQAELLQMRKEKQVITEQLQEVRNKSNSFEAKSQNALQDLQRFKDKYDEADREKVEAVTKLEVLDKYFKEREAQLQKELSKQESMWIEKQGEATSTIERIKYMQEELQNYKAQNESLKQEILEQEVQMKSQISVLEKKAHENWVSARQAERKLDEAKQEAAQLRNRLTLRERSFTEEKMHNRVQSPLEQNGEIPVSPAHISNDTAASPPLLFGTRENLTISPLPGLPFLPPPPGVPFMPPPLGGVPLPPPGFMPPPPSLLPGDHRPPPLGRISSPPLNSRYSPDRAYSPYSRNSPSPTSDDDYDRMPQPPMYRGYNSYDRREIHRPPPVRANPRSNKGGGHSSGSANSNDSLDKINRHNSKV